MYDADEFHASRADVEGNFLKTLDGAGVGGAGAPGEAGGALQWHTRAAQLLPLMRTIEAHKASFAAHDRENVVAPAKSPCPHTACRVIFSNSAVFLLADKHQ